MTTIIIGTVIAVGAIFAVRSIIKNLKSGGCAGGCSGCNGQCKH